MQRDDQGETQATAFNPDQVGVWVVDHPSPWPAAIHGSPAMPAAGSKSFISQEASLAVLGQELTEKQGSCGKASGTWQPDKPGRISLLNCTRV